MPIHILVVLRDIAKEGVSNGAWAALAKHGTRLIGALSALLDWATDYLYLYDVYRWTQGSYSVTKADILGCLDRVSMNSTGDCTAMYAFQRAECGQDRTIEVGVALLVVMFLCATAGCFGDALQASLSLNPSLLGGEQGGDGVGELSVENRIWRHKMHGYLVLSLVAIEDLPQLIITPHIELNIKPEYVVGDGSISSLALLSIIFGAVSVVVKAVAGMNEIQNAKYLASTEAAVERTANVLSGEEKHKGWLEADFENMSVDDVLKFRQEEFEEALTVEQQGWLRTHHQEWLPIFEDVGNPVLTFRPTGFYGMGLDERQELEDVTLKLNAQGVLDLEGRSLGDYDARLLAAWLVLNGAMLTKLS